MESIKCVTVGDGTVGKTCMMMSYIYKISPGDYIPTVFDNYSHTIEADGRKVRLGLWDTSGQENYDRLRPLVYPQTDVFLVCFAINSRNSFKNIELRWIPEIKHFRNDSKIILVGTKSDLRETLIDVPIIDSEKPVTFIEGYLLAKKIGASKYVECSAYKRNGLQEVFNAIPEAMWHQPEPRPKKWMCSIL